MYCLLQLYFCVATELAPHRPVLKLVSVKAVGKFSLPGRVVSASRHLDSIFDFLASHVSIVAKSGWGCQRCMTIALIRWPSF
jgi:hypothetical protein